MALVEARGVVKRFGEQTVLDGVDLEVEPHKVVALIGASGSGKSTLLRCINGLEALDGGTIRVDGRSVLQDDIKLNRLRRDVGIVFQSFNLFPHMSVIDNVMLAPRKVLGVSKADAADRARWLLDRIGLADKADAFPDRLSGGQQQRVAIVRAMAMRPKVLLLDEITSALDPELVDEVLEMVTDLAHEGMTMILATHEMDFARDVADKVCFLHKGSILEEGPPAEIFGSPRHERTAEFLRRSLEGRSR
ncbi:MAG: amino acid ABC transporter ATP-binding protein [Actinobacteria bacterium]|nr:amino acid ABC transporter ATP-binding protein [Actinomycetota bacterium]